MLGNQRIVARNHVTYTNIYACILISDFQRISGWIRRNYDVAGARWLGRRQGDPRRRRRRSMGRTVDLLLRGTYGRGRCWRSSIAFSSLSNNVLPLQTVKKGLHFERSIYYPPSNQVKPFERHDVCILRVFVFFFLIKIPLFLLFWMEGTYFVLSPVDRCQMYGVALGEETMWYVM